MRFRNPTDTRSNKKQVARPRLERLEAREVPAAYSFANGVFTINVAEVPARLVQIDSAGGLVRVGGRVATTVAGTPTGRLAAQSVTRIVVNGSEQDDAVSLAGVNTQGFRNLSGQVTVFGNGGNDTITGSAFDDEIHGGEGTDRVFGIGGRDRIFGESGHDNLWGDGNSGSWERLGGSDVIEGGDGNDYLSGYGGDDVMRGGDGNDTLLGGGGNDQLWGNAGVDRVDGGTAYDRAWYDAADASLKNNPSNVEDRRLEATGVAPAAPAKLRPANVWTRTVDLNWDDRSGNETAFVVYQSRDGVNYTEAGRVGAGRTGMRVNGLRPGTRYWFRVVAVNGAGASGASNTIEVATRGQGAGEGLRVDWNRDGIADLVFVKQANTGTGTTEVHIRDGATAFQTSLLDAGTPLHETGSNWAFQVADYNRDGVPDLVGFAKSGTGTGSTEIHVLDGASNFQNFSEHTGTALGEVGPQAALSLQDLNRDGRLDLVCVLKYDTGTGTTEVHALDGASGYRNWILHTGTALGVTGEEAEFHWGDFNRDGVLDLCLVSKNNTGSGRVEVHVLDGASGFQGFSVHAATALGMVGSEAQFSVGDYNGDGALDVYYVRADGTASGRVELHVLDGGRGFAEYLCEGPTALAAGEAGRWFV